MEVHCDFGIKRGMIKDLSTQRTFGCLLCEDGTEYLFEGWSCSIGDTVTFKTRLEGGKFFRAVDIQNYRHALEHCYWILTSDHIINDFREAEWNEFVYRYTLLKNSPTDISRSRTAKIALEFISNLKKDLREMVQRNP